MKYLDPRASLTFKRVFGEHPELVKSFLNALLPLDDDEQIESLEYLPAELVPDLELGKQSNVDVRCRDRKGRQFIVEVLMFWTRSFTKRVLFNAAKAYVNQAGKAERYELLQPVYALALLNHNYMKTVLSKGVKKACKRDLRSVAKRGLKKQRRPLSKR